MGISSSLGFPACSKGGFPSFDFDPFLPLGTAQGLPERWRDPMDEGREGGVERVRICKKSMDQLSLGQQSGLGSRQMKTWPISLNSLTEL